MDSVTQVLLGAAVGEAVAGRKAGNKAVLWGAVAGTIPDLDVISRYFMGTVDALEFHRGPTHSIAFAVLLSPLLGFLIRKLYPNGEATWRDWTFLVFMGLFTHALLDCFTTWGTELFWPFSDYRIAIKSVFVIDPLYTIPLLVCVLWLLFVERESKKRRRINRAGLLLSTGYLILTLIVKYRANQVFAASFDRQNLQVVRYESKPAPLNIILWTATIETPDGYLMGFYSFLDEDERINYHFFPKKHDLLEPFDADLKVKKLIDITDKWYTIEPNDKGVIFNNLRFGQRTGWETGKGKFVFSYKIFEKGEEVRVQEVEKDLGEGKEMLKPLIERVMGNKFNTSSAK
ncbi:Membrane-bound metal-dependent hydrolase [Fulvivirga imtechensis AK7]|uniref:Membrane-bound metal-dependent hydrolase n=1 Tax=Fulvivirga imtechensis AK7 TaxID=1237149 RepID=L8JW57_9BACT|nr:metal-dependent hydrolase [Fulvivirga imtechensis]ELR71844.1 Membrane-bound metal-dependent hydrolase [Fulvivirga imtechensis AK7]